MPGRDTTDRELAASIVARYAKDDPAMLADLAADATPKQFHMLFPVLEQHAEAAAARLGAELEIQPRPDWHDGPLEPDWPGLRETLKAQLEAAAGMVDYDH